MSVDRLEKITGLRLRSLVAEIFSRRGYHITEKPSAYPQIDILVAAPIQSDTKAYFVNVAGRASTDYLSKSDMESAIPRDLNIPDNSVLLVVTTKRYSSYEARQFARSSDITKDIWYVKDVLGYLREYDSEYLIDLYHSDKYQYHTKEQLISRLSYQNINTSNSVIDYIVENTYHPRRLMAYVELSHRNTSTALSDTGAVKEFINQTNVEENI